MKSSKLNLETWTRSSNRRGLIAQASFENALHLERKRAERSQASFVLLLLDCEKLLTAKPFVETLNKIESALSASTRETDAVGWFKDGAVVGVIFNELGTASCGSVTGLLSDKVRAALIAVLGKERSAQITLSSYVFPGDWQEPGSPDRGGSTLSLDFVHDSTPKKWALLVKKSVDIAGSLLGLALFSPAFVAIGIVIKLTSRGPILFCQERLGQYERPFKFLKFRSMYSENDPGIHKEYVKRLISGETGTEQGSNGEAAYKLTNDPRVTPVGRFLRRTSLDELPQFVNVLMGQMSLVGPRPPIPYEVNHYNAWHRGRMRVKPGITGLWQVKGRSKTKFDDMVRLDLEYARSWSLWLDFKIILQTPRVMFFGDGAF